MHTVLIVDDNPLDLRIAAKCLEELEIETRSAANGREALECLTNERPDAVLTDLDMPELNGLELVREVKRRWPALPVVLMTAKGSEELATTALKSGAASYVPKRNLNTELAESLRVVLDIATSRKERQRVLDVMTTTESQFQFGYEPEGPLALVAYCQDALRMMRICGEADLLRVGTALGEAIINAVEHGNLELDSSLRAVGDGDGYDELYRRRIDEAPFKDRRVRVAARLTKSEAVYVVRDEGPGFDPSSLPDPTDPENLMSPSGRGLLLIRTFMDEVRFNAMGNEITMVKRKTAAM